MFGNLGEMLYSVPAILIALTIHEYAHARTAYAFGDPTAKYRGRLTLNPARHIDPIGFVMLLVARFGWAKPVPINPANFQDYRHGLFWVSLAGPLSNFALGFIAVLLHRLLTLAVPFFTIWHQILYYLVIINIFVGVFNLLPVPPLDGSKILSSMLSNRYRYFFHQIEPYGPLILILIIVTRLINVFILPVAVAVINLFNAAAVLLLRI